MFVLNSWDSLKERVVGLLPRGTLRARFARGAFWAVAGTVIAQALALAASIVVARLFDSKTLYGELGMIRNTVVMFGIVAGMGLGLTSTKHVAEFRVSDPARAGRIIRLSFAVATGASVLMSLAVFFLAPWLAARTLSAAHLETALRIGCIILFFEALNGVQLSTLAGFEAFKAVARLSFLRGIAMFPLMVGGAWLGKPYGSAAMLHGVLWGLAGAAAFGWFVNRLALRRLYRNHHIPPASLADARLEFGVLWAFSLPALLATVMGVFAPWAAAALLVHLLRDPGFGDLWASSLPTFLHGAPWSSGLCAADTAVVLSRESGYAALGVFNAANQWQVPVTLLSTQVAIVLLPMLASFGSGPDGRRRSDRAVEAAHLVIVVAVLPLVALLSCFPHLIMGLYGEKFAPYIHVLWAALFVAGVKSLGAVAGTLLATRGAMWTTFFINLVWAAALLALVLAWARGAERYADVFSISYLAAALAALLLCGARRFCSWTLAGNILLVTGCLAVVSYGMAFVGSVWVRLALFAGACLIAGLAALRAWRRLKASAIAGASGRT